MVKIILLMLGILFISCPSSPYKEQAGRALFVSVIQDPPVLASHEAIIRLIDFAKQARIKTLFVQIYHSGQAWFPSEVVDDSHYKKSRLAVSQDPLALLIRQAHAQGLEVHAWLNLLSLGNNTSASFLKRYGPDVLSRNLKPKNRIEDFKIDHQYFLDPSDERVRNDLAKIIAEVLRAYPDLDGLQFDYIRYCDVNPHYGYTSTNIANFKKVYGLKAIDDSSLLWKNWKRSQVTGLLMKLVKEARAIKPGIKISTTGCMPYARAYDEAFQDWASWLSSGLVDFVTVMDYSIDVKQFERWFLALKEKVQDPSKLKIAVGAYKTVHTPEIFEKEFSSCENRGQACVVFHYGSLLQSPEMQVFLKKR